MKKTEYDVRHPKAPLDHAKRRMLTELEKRELERQDSIDRWKKKQLLEIMVIEAKAA